jgi:hypothetical protein
MVDWIRLLQLEVRRKSLYSYGEIPWKVRDCSMDEQSKEDEKGSVWKDSESKVPPLPPSLSLQLIDSATLGALYS